MKLPKIGLALSAGGVRAISQISVIEQLEKAGLFPDIVAGSSAGAVVAACYGLGTLTDLKKFLLSIRRRDLLRFIDAELSASGLIKGYKIARQLKKLTQGKRLEEGRMPIGVVATDFQTGQVHVFHRGRPSRPLMASCAMPIVFKPVKIKGRIFLDGGLSAYLPVETCRQMGADFVIGVDCSQKGVSFWAKVGEKQRYSTLWRQFYQNKKKNRLDFLTLLTQSLDVFSAQAYDKNKPVGDYLIKVKVKLFTFDFHQSRQALQTGKKAGKAAAQEIKKLLKQNEVKKN